MVGPRPRPTSERRSRGRSKQHSKADRPMALDAEHRNGGKDDATFNAKKKRAIEDADPSTANNGKDASKKQSRGRPKKLPKKDAQSDVASDSEVKNDEKEVESKAKESIKKGKADATFNPKKKRAIDDADPSAANDGKEASKKQSRGRPKKLPKKDAQSDVASDSEIKNDEKEVEIKAKKSIKKGVDRSVVKKGAAAVDGHCPIASSSHVFCEGNDIWDCMLNQTNIQFNNNKYYLIQLLEDDNKKSFSVWMRWGRVGCNGQNSFVNFGGNIDGAKNAFRKKFSDKTRNDWDSRQSFQKVNGKYDLLSMDYSNGQDEVDTPKDVVKQEIKPKKKVECTLAASIRKLLELICDIKAMEEAVVEMKYDANKAPLGKLTAEQVKAGYSALKEIERIIAGSGKPSNKDLLYACNDFYTRVPHYFGMKVPPLIRTRKEIQEKMTLLQALGDIQAAMNFINQPLDDDVHPVDQHYKGLECDIESLGKADPEYKILETYLKKSHGKTHTFYKMELEEIFKVRKTQEGSRFKDVGNRMLLWHGSRLTNWAGILNQGLRIAPPEAPSTGYMFGKGIYFADMSSKSANYCMPSFKNQTGLLVLCDVALGKCNELKNANYQGHKLPKGCHSVMGIGTSTPDPKNYVKLADGVTVPLGPAIDRPENCTLQYNEFVVYDVAQVKLRYLMKIKFNMS